MNPTTSPTKQRNAVSQLVAGVTGGLVVLVVGSILIATNVIDTGDSTTVVRQAPLSQPASDGSANGGGRTVQDIYRNEGKGVVYIESTGVSGGQDALGQQQSGTALSLIHI